MLFASYLTGATLNKAERLGGGISCPGGLPAV